MLNFFNDYVRFDRGLDYQALKVKENFIRVLDTLGEPDKRDTIISITIRLKGKADWIAANNASNALEFKVSRRFWGRKSKYVKLPYVAAIESSKNWDKEHIHALIRMKDLKENYEPLGMEQIIKDIAYDLNEVNSRDNHLIDGAVKIRSFPYEENKYKVVGQSIEYICKSSSTHHNPLERKLLQAV